MQYKVPAFGWSSTKEHIGIWFINPSIEYLSGGASKQELVCHFDGNNNPDPIILDYWARHALPGAGATWFIAAGEKWSKVIGPIYVYCNALANSRIASQADLEKLSATSGDPVVPPAWKENATALWRDALEQAKQEKARWPYDWVRGVDYPHKDERGTVAGQLVLKDPQAATSRLPNLTVGLARAPIHTAGGGIGGGGGRGKRGRPPGRGAEPQGDGGISARREILPILERRQRGRQIHDCKRPSGIVYAPCLCRRRAGREFCKDRHHR